MHIETMPEMIRARVSPDQKRAVQKAAMRRGQTLSQFIRSAALSAAGADGNA